MFVGGKMVLKQMGSFYKATKQLDTSIDGIATTSPIGLVEHLQGKVQDYRYCPEYQGPF